MGVERAVTRWYVQRQGILGEINALEAKLAQLSLVQTQTEEQKLEQRAMEHEFANTQAKLRGLGPCPKPMMG